MSHLRMLISSKLKLFLAKIEGTKTEKEKGKSGTFVSGGNILEDLDLKLTGREGAEIFDQMRRDDSQIAMILDVAKSPIKTAKFFIEPVDDSDEEKEIAELIRFILFDGMENTWDEFLTEYLSNMEFGFSMFEIVPKNATNSPIGDHIGLENLSWRSPKSINKWNINKNGKLESVEQILIGDIAGDTNAPVIPAAKLLIFSYNKEGSNFEGISMLRALHANFVHKKVLKNIQATGSKRASTGIPVGKFPGGSGADETDVDAFIAGIKNFSSEDSGNHIAYPNLPKDDANGQYDFDVKTITHDSAGLNASIERENKEMADRAMQGFMNMAGGGSYALGSDLSDMFLGNIKTYPNLLVSVLNKRLIPLFVDINFGRRKKYPKMDYSGVNDKAGKELVEIINLGTMGGFIEKSPALTRFVHAAFGLPDSSGEEIAEPVTETRFNELVANFEKKYNQKLTFASVDLTKKQPPARLISRFTDKYAAVMQTNLDSISAGYIDKVVNAVLAGNVGNALQNARSVEIDGARRYNKDLETLSSDQVEIASKQAAREFGDINFSEITLNLKRDYTTDGKCIFADVPAQGKNKVKNQRISVVDQHLLDLQKVVLFTVGNTFDHEDVSKAELTGALNDKTQDHISRVVKTSAVNMSAAVTNAGRNSVYQSSKVLDRIDSFIFVNHSPVAKICVELAGRVFTKDEYLTTSFLPPLHHNCESYIVAQRINQQEKRVISPTGLMISGSEKEQESILKSANFV